MADVAGSSAGPVEVVTSGVEWEARLRVGIDVWAAGHEFQIGRFVARVDGPRVLASVVYDGVAYQPQAWERLVRRRSGGLACGE